MVRDKCAELAAARGNRTCAIVPGRFVGEERDVLMDDHVAAGTRRNHDRTVGGFEHGNRVACRGAGVVMESGVEGGLSATRLIEWDVDFVAEALEHAHDGKA